MTKVRVAVGGFRYESNSFAGAVGTAEQFDGPGMRYGEGVVDAAPENSELAGARAVAREDGAIELLGTLDGFGGCGAPLPETVYETVADELVERLGRLGELDAVYLALHGAMTTTGREDADADLIGRVREAVGEATPIVVSFDLHAAVGPRVAGLVEGLVGYKTCPHTDFVETGRKALSLAAAAARGESRPQVVRVTVPMLTAAEAHDTTSGPLAPHMDLLQGEVARRALLDGSIFACQPWLDTPRSTWTVTVTADRAHEDGMAQATELAAATRQQLLDAIDTFVVTKTPVGGLWAAVEHMPDGTVLVSDSGDSPSAGAPGDSIDCLRVLVRPDKPSVLATVTDPDAVEASWRMGVGTTFALDVGGRLTPGLDARLPLLATVRALAEGRYTRLYPAGPVDVGRCAVIHADNLHLVITSRPAFMLDTTLFEYLNLDPRAYRVVQVKSAGGFRALWRPVSTATVMVDSIGASTSQLASLPFKHLPEGLWPFNDEPRGVRRGDS